MNELHCTGCGLKLEPRGNTGRVGFDICFACDMAFSVWEVEKYEPHKMREMSPAGSELERVSLDAWLEQRATK